MATNEAIAAALSEFADLLELSGANPFKVNAFRRASRACEAVPSDLAIWARSEKSKLREIEGVGESTANHIVEFVTLGKIPDLERLRSEVPAGLPPLLTLQGLGPKTVRVLWESAKVTSLEGLKAALDEGKLDAIPGMGAKKIANIREAVEARLAAGDAPVRHRLGQAVPIAEALLARLMLVPGTQRAQYAGSARRGRETVGDLDLLVSSTNPEAVRKAFVALPDVAKVLASGETRCSVLLHPGIQVDLRVVEDAAFGAALLYFTGSKDHNVRLRERSIARGMRLNEYGLFHEPHRSETPPTEIVAAASEPEIYAALELPYWPPELRESDGLDAITATPRLIELADIKSELHSHTNASDGDLTIDELANLAKSRGFHTLAVTDHSKASAQANGLSVERLLRHIDAIREAEARVGGIRLLAGSEVDILADGRLDYDDETLAKLDLVVASPHTALRQDPAAATRRLLAAIRHPLVHILGHPTGRIVGGREGLSPDMDALYAAAKECSTALEINSHWMRLDLRDVHVRGAVNAGCLIAIDCDTHRPADADNLRYGIATARRGGLAPESCVNTWTQPRLLTWLKSKR